MTVVTNIRYEEEKEEKKDEEEEVKEKENEKEEEDREWQMGGGFNAGTMQAKRGERRDKGDRPVNLPSLKRPPPRVSCLCHILSVTAPSFDGIDIGKICQPPFVETTPYLDPIHPLPMMLALVCSIPLSISKSEQ